MEILAETELINLINSVFPRFDEDKKLAILVDIPRSKQQDNDSWQQRRNIAWGWYQKLKDNPASMDLQSVNFIAYQDVGSNNADLPEKCYLLEAELPDTAGQFGQSTEFEKIFIDFQLFLAPTEYSATAPLKNAAKKFGFRAATMPGFSPAMIPALRIDYNEVARRVRIIKEKVDPAVGAEACFLVDLNKEFRVYFDLRYRLGHESSGRFPHKSVAGNLPSGETYIVPYEGELGVKSETSGILPVQIGQDVVYFTLKENKAVKVEGEGATVLAEREHLTREPAYGNIAELGFGILADFGLQPINEILLDEKLGFHVAFGRSDHFGGNVGPGDFSSPSEVIHLDQIYIEKTQPRVMVKSLKLKYLKGEEEIIKDNRYTIF